MEGKILHDIGMLEVDFGGESPQTRSSGAPRKTKNPTESSAPKNALQENVNFVNSVSRNGTSPVSSGTDDCMRNGSPECNVSPLAFGSVNSFAMEAELTSVDSFSPAIIFLPSHPTREELSNIVAATHKGTAITGSAAKAQIGSVLGLVDIGECEDSYLFRVSLPGVKRDEREFSCEVENDGKVLIRGVTVTGEKTVSKYSQTFEMQSQNLCPPGQFSISFKLPGPVDPEQFIGNFGTDAILEGIVMKDGLCKW